MNRQELMDKYKDEKVYVVPTYRLDSLDDKFTPTPHDPKIWKEFDSMGFFMNRYEAEGNHAFQQIIPYIVIFNNDATKIYTTRRIKGDHRLVDRYSIGCGGHINEEDGPKDIVFNAAKRELFEEISTNYTSNFKKIGYMRDIASATNDHTGIVLTITADEDNIQIKETDKLSGSWMDLDQLIMAYENLENWSRYIVDYLVHLRNLSKQ